MIIVPYNRTHLYELQPQEHQAHVMSIVTPEQAKTLETKWAFTGKDNDGKVLICAGVIEVWANRGLAWTYIDKDAGKHFKAIHNASKRFFDYCPLNRIEATVHVNFEQGHRWMRLLGFTLEAKVMRMFLPNGEDMALYAKVKNG